MNYPDFAADDDLNTAPATGADNSTRVSNAVSRASACPGLLRIATALDGGICRIKLTGGRLGAAQALAIAEAAELYGSGAIEITNRANVQIRGVRMAQADALIGHLLNAGLGPSVPGGDDVRNIMLTPTLGIDRALWDIEPLAAQLSMLLQTRFAALSPKFALLLDGGERIAMLEHAHDIWLAAMPVPSGDEPLLAFGLAGCPPLSNDAAAPAALAAVPARHAFELIEQVLQLFVELAGDTHTRMRHVLTELPAPEFLQRLQRRLGFALRSDAMVMNWRRQASPPYEYIGVHAQRQNGLQYVGAAPVLGRVDAAQLRGLAELLTRDGAARELRATPWQSVLLTAIEPTDVARVIDRLQQLGFSCDADAALTRSIACAGAVGCAKGLADTKTDAKTLAAALQRNLPRGIARPAVHLSGCARSCAAAHVAEFTLLAVAPGHYDVFRRADNVAGFGQLIAARCSIDAAVGLLTELSTASSVS